jgi:flavin-dependent dehydrogenase
VVTFQPVYDAIVVGARCAGAPTAMLLARRGRRVLLVDRATFPSDTLSTHYMARPAIAYLARWGLRDRFAATGAPPIQVYTSDWGDFTLVGRPPPIEGEASGFAPRRTILDALLIEAAASAGAELRERFPVHDLLWEDDRVVGVRGPTDERARVVIGADGRNSLVARRAGAAKYRDTPALAFQYYAYWSGVSRGLLESYRRGRTGYFLFPTNDDLACVIVARPIERFAAFRADPVGSYRDALAAVPELADRLAAGRQEERLIGTCDLPNFFRTPHGPGWALVGDAGYHKDPQTGQGIRDCFRDAELLAEAVETGDYADYQRRRDHAVDELYEHTLRVAAMAAPTQADFELRAALRDNRPDTDLFFALGDGTIAPSAFFAPDNIARIKRAAGIG